VTIGREKETAQSVCDCGAQHEICNPDAIIVDAASKIVTTPAYMYDATTIARVDTGIAKMVAAVLAMTRK